MAGHQGLLLPTSVIGSYSVPDWLERLKSDFYRGGVSRAQLDEIHDVAIKAALKDQEVAGIDIVTDGELRRDNDIDYVLASLPGVDIATPHKAYYFDYYNAEVVSRLPSEPPPSLGLVDDFAFARSQTDRPVKVSFTGPFSLSRRLRNSYYSSEHDLVLALAQVLHVEAQALADAGATMIQIDEPSLAGYPDQAALAIEAINVVTKDVSVEWGLHVCYGNRYSRPSWEGHYDFLFPAVLDAGVDQLLLEFARKGYQDLEVVSRAGWDRKLGLGVIDVKSVDIEPVEVVENRIRRAMEYVDADRLIINPDCGLRHLTPDRARAKLAVMVAATHSVRDALTASEPAEPAEPAEPPAPAEEASDNDVQTPLTDIA
jgi:5-methyltetrahydropteroyltriglutamate--homocysteine methyltransferase